MCLILRNRGYHFGKFDVYYPWNVMNYLLELQRNPNAEIKEIFETIVIKWFDDSDKKWNRNELFVAVWSGEAHKRDDHTFAEDNDQILCYGIFFLRNVAW